DENADHRYILNRGKYAVSDRRRSCHDGCVKPIYAHSSCPGLTRASIALRESSHEEDGLPGHRRAEATPSFGRLCPAMARENVAGPSRKTSKGSSSCRNRCRSDFSCSRTSLSSTSQ